MQSQNFPNISKSLLWEYNIDKFDFNKSYKIVIERILERGTMEEWKEMYNYYSIQKILETIEWSSQLQERDKKFSKFFLKSDFFHVI